MSASRHDVVCVGEALVDFLPSKRGQRVRDVERWTPCLGGAPANVTVGVARLGGSSALVGVTGADEFGHFLRDGLAREGVDVRWLRQTSEGRTGLGFVSLTATGERSFTFYRTRAAETFLCAQDALAGAAAIRGARVVHVGTNSLIQPRARAAVRRLVREAARRGQLVSSDPNLRLHLWRDPSVLKRLVHELIASCAVLKLSEEEIEFVTGQSRPTRALDWLEARGVTLPIVTLGPKGAVLRFRGVERRVPAPRATVIDTTGAGDGFTSAMLFGLSRVAASRAELEALPVEHVTGLARFACVVGAHVVTKLGAVAGLPPWSSVRREFPSDFKRER